jgi:hypothetical protein
MRCVVLKAPSSKIECGLRGWGVSWYVPMAVLRATESTGTEPPGLTDHLYSFFSPDIVRERECSSVKWMSAQQPTSHVSCPLSMGGSDQSLATFRFLQILYFTFSFLPLLSLFWCKPCRCCPAHLFLLPTAIAFAHAYSCTDTGLAG